MKNMLRNIIKVVVAIAFVGVVAIGTIEIIFAASQVGADVMLYPYTRYIAHRGLSSTYYQNSREAFVAAAESNFFYGIETDVWLTQDGVWVCCHDNNPFLDASATITSLSYSQAMALPLAPDKAGEGVEVQDKVYLCDFSSYLEICRAGNKTPIIEIKYNAAQNQLQSLLDATKEFFSLSDVQYISFHKDVVDTLQGFDKELVVQWLINKDLQTYYASRCGYNMSISKANITAAAVKTAHAKNRYVGVWTVNNKDQAKAYEAMGVDFITTDYDFSKM